MPIDKASTVHTTIQSTVQGTQLEVFEVVNTGAPASDIDESGDITCTLGREGLSWIYLDVATLDDGVAEESMSIDEIKVDGIQIGDTNAFYAAHVLDLINLNNGNKFDADVDGSAELILVVNGVALDDTIEIEFTATNVETDGTDDMRIVAFFKTTQGSDPTCVWTNG